MTSEQRATARDLYIWRGHSIVRIAEALGLEIADVAAFIDPDAGLAMTEPKGKRHKKPRVRRTDILDGVLSEVISDRSKAKRRKGAAA